MIDYDLGIIWASGTISNDESGPRLVLRNKDIEVLKDIASRNNLNYKPFLEKHAKRWAIKIPLTTDIGKRMIELGYTQKKDKARRVPEGAYDQYEWLRGYLSQRAHINKIKEGWALRIYGAYHIIVTIDEWLHNMYGVGIKKPQHIMSHVDQYSSECWSINYKSTKEIGILTKSGIFPDKEVEKLTRPR